MNPNLYTLMHVSYIKDAKVPNCGIFTLHGEDHTLGNLLRAQLLEDARVVFAGYKVPHPLESRVEIKIETTADTTPVAAFLGMLCL